MVLKRKLNCGFNSFDLLNIPKAPRSSRRKVPCKRADDDDGSQICAFDLLASLAEKLLEESESSSTSTYVLEGDNQDRLGVEIKQEHDNDYNNPYKSEFSEQENTAQNSTSGNTSVTCLQFPSLKNECNLKPRCENKKEDCDFLIDSGVITEETGIVNMDTAFEQREVTNGLIPDRDLKFPRGSDRVPNGSFEGYLNHSKLHCRDNDENYCKYHKHSDRSKSYRPLTRVGNRRTKKSAMTKYRRALHWSKCFEDNRTDGCLKALYGTRKLFYGYSPWKHETDHRKRRLSDKGSVVNSDGVLSSESVSNSPKKGESENGVFPAAIGLHSKDSHVKFSIKSLRIPELLIEVPETATVGSLKRTVMEAVTALLGDGIRIGVLVKGKKVRDDDNTLSQTGLSSKENLGNLGFTLEPCPDKLPVPLCTESPVVSMTTDSTNLSERSTASPVLDPRILFPLQRADHLINSGNLVENSQELVLYQSDISADEHLSSDSRALVQVLALESEALAIVPVNEKPKRTEISQRRTRRPFSVTEVEALVQSVEELGTGRWRDVKLRSFENATHRTYVDLKDKWKTLVHTASISPQQRRGEAVPQELLDRVLSAHRYWSQHQMKQNVKHHVAASMVVQSVSSM